MTRPDKLYRSLLDNPRQTIAFRDFVRLIDSYGWQNIRTKGSHRSYAHDDCPELLVIQPKGSDAKPYQVKQFLAYVEEYGLEPRK
jgi:predicted RNA binding protein YcfA (HicA-like mRNA interferase family)